MPRPDGEERRKETLSEDDVERLAPAIASWILSDQRSVNRITDAVEKALWEGWFLELGKIAFRAVLYILGAGSVALAGWLAATGKLIS